ncbi:t-SNARE [Caulochytrium protostelioides]|nr:t-SNARE [Caulochytrium protostelioides]
MSHLPPRWLQVIDDIDRAVAEMRGQVSELEVLHRRHLMAGFDDAGSEGQIHALTGAITTSLQAAQRRVKRVLPDGAPLPSDPAQATAQARALSKNVQMSLAAKLQDVSTTFRKAQSAYLGKLRARETRGKDVFSGAAAGMAEISPEDAELDAVFTDAQMRLVQDNEEVVSQREREINAIVKSIHDLAAIFQELQTMVIDQGTVLDRIDYNIENTQVHLESAHSELVKAQSYQNNWPAKICIGLLIVVCALIFIAVIVKKSRYTAPANNGNVTTIIIGTEDTASGL